jgi:hypothetical protein
VAGNPSAVEPVVDESFDASLSFVWERIGAFHNPVHHNRANELLLAGCAHLGLPAQATATNLTDSKVGPLFGHCLLIRCLMLCYADSIAMSIRFFFSKI